jgi:hypothetical protein
LAATVCASGLVALHKPQAANTHGLPSIEAPVKAIFLDIAFNDPKKRFRSITAPCRRCLFYRD